MARKYRSNCSLSSLRSSPANGDHILYATGLILQRVERMLQRETPGNHGSQRLGPALSEDAEMLDGRLKRLRGAFTLPNTS